MITRKGNRRYLMTDHHVRLPSFVQSWEVTGLDMQRRYETHSQGLPLRVHSQEKLPPFFWPGN